MQTRNKYFVLIVLVIAGVVLLNYSNVRAEVDPEVDPYDGICSPAEIDKGLCMQAWDYVIEVLPCHENGGWPCVVQVEGVPQLAFTYRAYAPADCKSNKDNPTWSYLLTLWETCGGGTGLDYITGSVPDGSAQIVPNSSDSKCPEIVEDEGTELWKLNPALNCRKQPTTADITIYTEVDAGLSCGNKTWVRTAIGCSETGYLRGPGCYKNMQIVATKQEIANGAVVLDTDICSGNLDKVTINDQEAVSAKAWICVGDNPLDGNSDTATNCTGRLWFSEDSACIIKGSWNVGFGGFLSVAPPPPPPSSP
jgi:hypothetical protein